MLHINVISLFAVVLRKSTKDSEELASDILAAVIRPPSLPLAVSRSIG